MRIESVQTIMEARFESCGEKVLFYIVIYEILRWNPAI